MTHIGYGLVNLPEGKMSSRKGNVVLYEDLRDQVYKQLVKESKTRHADWGEEKLHDVAMALTMAVLKFSMQKHEAQKNFVFDMKEAVSFEGFSAPYILYVVARINSLIKKSEITSHSFQGDVEILQEKEEKKLLVLMAGYGEVVEKALVDYNPSVITKYCFDVAQAFNEFYNKHQILGVADRIKNVRLQLCFVVKNVLKQALSLLSITSVDEM
jgi:arginyl-tRNA synthetase